MGPVGKVSNPTIPDKTRQDQIGSKQLQIALKESKRLLIVVKIDPNGDWPRSPWSCELIVNSLSRPSFCSKSLGHCLSQTVGARQLEF